MFKIYLNGKIVPLAKAKISVRDRGFLYGDGIFESLRTYGGKPFLLKEHLKRLKQGLKTLEISEPEMVNAEPKMQEIIKKLMKANRLKEAYLKIMVTRGEARRHGLDPKRASGKPTVVILVEKIPTSPKKGWKAIISRISQPKVPTSRIKSLNYLDNILAKMEAQKVGADEAILLDEKGRVSEGTISNVFIVKRNTIYTPSLENPILPGVTRRFVIKSARQLGLKVVEKNIFPRELFRADECFVTFSGAGVVPIIFIGKKKIGGGRVGPITKKLICTLPS